MDEDGGRRQNRSLTHDVDLEGIANKMRDNKSKKSKSSRGGGDDDGGSSPRDSGDKGCCTIM